MKAERMPDVSEIPSSAPLPRWIVLGWRIGLVATIVTGAVMAYANEQLKTPAAPQGILSLQFTNEITSATKLLQAWGPDHFKWAQFSLRFDLLFMTSYGLLLWCGCLETSWKLGGKSPVYFLWWVAALPWLAVGFDLLENLFHWVGLDQFQTDAKSTARVIEAHFFATIKFSLLGISLLYALIARTIR